MHDATRPKLEISGFKVTLNVIALVLAVFGATMCAGGRWLPGIAAAYAGFLIVFFCGMHGVAECRRAGPR